MIPTPKLTPEQEVEFKRQLDFARRAGSRMVTRFTDAGSEFDPEAPPRKPVDLDALVAQWEAEDAAEEAAAKKAAEEQGTSRE